LSDADYTKFVTWVKTQKFEYPDQLEKRTDDLIAAAKHERYYNELSASLSDLKNRIAANRESEFTRFKKEITTLLETEIAFHYSLHAGQADVSADRDTDIIEALKILHDDQAYAKILQPK
jgi:hypothetical protein